MDSPTSLGKRIAIVLAAFLIFGVSTAVSAGANIIYVNQNAPPTSDNSGTSWQNAFTTDANFSALDKALAAAAAKPNSQIWVAAGTYSPALVYTAGGKSGGAYGVACVASNSCVNGYLNSLKTFNLPSNVAIYGGFMGNESQLSQRNGLKNPTILSGGNAIWHVLTAGDDVTPAAVTGVLLDSLIIQNGFANGPDAGPLTAMAYAHSEGGGLLARYGSQVTLQSVIFQNNTADGTISTFIFPPFPGFPPIVTEAAGGGAIAAIDNNTVITINNNSAIKNSSVFKNNIATFLGGNGGAIAALFGATVNVASSSFTGNVADRTGGALTSNKGTLVVTGSNFANNITTGTNLRDEAGGAIGTYNANLNVGSSTFNNNSSFAGGGAILFHTSSNAALVFQLSNSLFNNNMGGFFGGGAVNVFGGSRTPSAATVTINNAVFTNNTAGLGGAVYIDSIPSTINNATFISNSAWIEGGALFESNFSNSLFNIPPTQMTVSNSLFLNNNLIGPPAGFPPLPVIFTLFAQGFGAPVNEVDIIPSGGGAAAVEFGGIANFKSNGFGLNKASGGNGGAILVGGTIGIPTAFNTANATVSNSLCIGNTDSTGNNNIAVLSGQIVGGC